MSDTTTNASESVTLSLLNLKGGVGKSISAINMAHILAAQHNKRVLLIDNDKQGNTSKFFGLHSYEAPSIAEALTQRGFDIRDAIAHTAYEGLDVLPGNMNLLRANKEILLDVSRPQQTRLRTALESVAAQYDYIVIDNAPDLNMSVINALVASDDVLIPIKMDNFALDGVREVRDQVAELRDFNAHIRIRGCFITMYQKNGVNTQGEALLGGATGLPVFRTVIRKTVRVDETTFVGKPLLEYARNSTATRDYVGLVAEYLEGE